MKSFPPANINWYFCERESENQHLVNIHYIALKKLIHVDKNYNQVGLNSYIRLET